MKFLFTLLCLGVFYSHDLFAQIHDAFKSDVNSVAKPWTNTNFYNKPENFQFAIVSDRTNGHRNGIFEEAVDILNGMKPEFVLCIGDLIEGYTRDTTVLHEQWAEFDGIIKPLTVPFFYIPGNHDVSNEVQHDLWIKKFGRDYYHFLYKDVLFIAMNSNDGDGIPFSEQQLNYVKKVIQQNANVRWTFLLMHHPVWNKRDSNGFMGIEQMLKGRPYTVIAGHTHRYLYATHNERDYYILGTTGGSNRLRGAAFGETDHISWVTMTDKGPSLMNLELQGMLKPDFSNQRTSDLANAISKTSAIEPFVMLPEVGQRKGGQVYLNLKNPTDLPVIYRSRVYQNLGMGLSENVIDLEIPAHGTTGKTLQILAGSDANYSSTDSISLKWQMKYKSMEKGLPSLSGILEVPFQKSIPKIIDTSIAVFIKSKMITVENPYPNTVIRYTINGAEPDRSSPVYKSPILIKDNTDVKVKVFTTDGIASSATQTARFNEIYLKPPVNFGNRKLSPGLSYAFYVGVFKMVPNFSLINPLRTGILYNFNLDPVKKDRLNQFAMQIEGFVKIEEDNLYRLFLTSDDGCNLYIDDELVVNNDGSHSARTRDGFVALKKGLHKIRFDYFEDFDGEQIQLEYEKVGEGVRKEIPFSNYMREKL